MKIYCVQGGDVAQEGGDAAQEGGDAHNGGDLELKKKMANKIFRYLARCEETNCV